jgi:hypothetical protein
MRNTTVLTIAAVATLALAACGKSPGERLAEAAIEASTGQKAEIDADSGQVTFKTDQGDMKIVTGDDAKLPAQFPKDVFLPADYTVASAMEMPGALVVELDAKGQVAPMFAEADKRMLDQGWKQRVAMQQSADSQVAIYEKGDRNATLSLYDNEGKGVKLSVQVQAKQQ